MGQTGLLVILRPSSLQDWIRKREQPIRPYTSPYHCHYPTTARPRPAAPTTQMNNIRGGNLQVLNLRQATLHVACFVFSLHVNMPLSPPTFEAICEIGIFTAASLHIERLHIAAPAAFYIHNINLPACMCTPLRMLHVRLVHAPTKPPLLNPHSQ